MRPMFGAFGPAATANSVAFVSASCKASGAAQKYGLGKRIEVCAVFSFLASILSVCVVVT